MKFRALALAAAVSLVLAPAAQAQSSSGSSGSSEWLPGMSSALGEVLSSAGSSMSSARELSSQPLWAGAQLPGEAGKLVARKPVPRVNAERILYTSTNERGQIVPVSGALYPAKGESKGTVVLAPGTRGMGDQCAPSAAAGLLANVGWSTANLNYEAPIAQRLADEGYQVVVTDYIGLGTPGLHTYLNRVDQGHAVIDAARSVVKRGEKVFFYGYSQGGGATAAAGELQPGYAPELNLVGIYSGAPPADPEAVLAQGDPKQLEGVASFVIASYAYSYPEFRDALTDHAGPAAVRYLAAVAASCLPEVMMSSAPLEKFNAGASMQDIVASDARIRDALRRNRLGNVPVQAPILIMHSPADPLVPFPQGKQLAADYRALGSPVEFREVVLSESSSRAGMGHVAPAITQNGAAIAWMNDRFAGKAL